MSYVRVFYWALGGAYSRHGFKACHVSFLRRAGCCRGKDAETKKDVRFAGLAASNGRRRENEGTRVTNFDCMRYLLMDA